MNESVSDAYVTDLERDVIFSELYKEFEKKEPDVFISYDPSEIEDLLNEKLDEVLSHPVFKRMKFYAVARKVIRLVKKEHADSIKNDALDVVYGYWLGGEDWKPSPKSGKTIPDKQSIVILTNSGEIRTMGVFGHTPTEGVEFEPYVKYKFLYTTYVSSTTGKKYDTVQSIEADGGSEEEFFELVRRSDMYTEDEISSDLLYTPVFMRSKVRWVAPKNKFVPVGEIPVYENGSPVYDEYGNPVMKEKYKVSDENEHVLQRTLDDREDVIHVGQWTVGEKREDRYVKVMFYNKRLGRHVIDTKVFRDEEFIRDTSLLDPDDAAEFLLDEVFMDNDKELLFLVIPKSLKTYTNKDGVLVENVKLTSTFVTDRYDFEDGD